MDPKPHSNGRMLNDHTSNQEPASKKKYKEVRNYAAETTQEIFSMRRAIAREVIQEIAEDYGSLEGNGLSGSVLATMLRQLADKLDPR